MIKSENKKGNPFHDEEGKFTSSKTNSEQKIKDMGFAPKEEVDKETERWLKAGFDEKMYEPPLSVSISDDVERVLDDDDYKIGVEPEDLVDFLSERVDLSEEDKEVILYNSVIPSRIAEDNFDEEEFVEWVRDKNPEKIKEIEKQIGEDLRESGRNPFRFFNDY